MRPIEEIQEEALKLHQRAVALRARLAGLVGELKQRREADGWSAAEEMTLDQVAVAEESELPKSYLLHGFLTLVEQEVAADLERSLKRAAMA